MKPRFSVPLACLVGLLAPMTRGAAETPQPMPPYSDARLLREDASLRAVAFGDQQIGIACGERGTILRTSDGGKTWLIRESRVDCRLDDIVWMDQQRAVIVGGGYDRITKMSRGAVLYTQDGGHQWHRAIDEELPRLKSVHARQDGSLVAHGDWSHSLLTDQLESHDGGRSWHDLGEAESGAPEPRPPTVSRLRKWVDATGMPVPIRDACRINASTLCAVGDQGVILRSGDGGQSWHAARGENRHAAVLFVARHPASVAWSLLGSEALEARHRVALLVHHASSTSSHEPSPSEVANQVTVMVGGAGADAVATLGDDIFRAATQWCVIHRPAALVLDQSLPADVQDAFLQAAASSGVPRVVGYSFDSGGNTTRHRNELLPKSGVLASDLFADAMHYVAPHQSSASSIALRYLYDAAPATRRGDSVVSGIPLEQGQQLAAPSQQASRRQLQIVQARLNQAERIAELVHSGRTPSRFSEALESTLDQTAKDDQFRLAWSVLLETIARDSNSSAIALHEAALGQLASRFPATSAGRWAQLRRESIRHSLEWKRLRSSLADSAIASVAAPAAETVPVSPFQVPSNSVRQVSAVAPLVVPKPETHDMTRRSATVVEVDLAWEFHPLVLFAQEAARRRGDDGQLQVAGGHSANLQRLAETENHAWSRLLQSGGPNVIAAPRAASPPRLDGLIDDPCWHAALSSPKLPPRIRLAYDDDYLYVALQCRASQLRPDTLAGRLSPTERDQDLTNVDRMRMCIDTDRDLMTAMQLQVSDAGRTQDAIDGSLLWQPTWYVATDRNDDQVTIEMAILRRDLVELPIPAEDSWFISAQSLRAGEIAEPTLMPTPSDWMRVIFQP